MLTTEINKFVGATSQLMSQVYNTETPQSIAFLLLSVLQFLVLSLVSQKFLLFMFSLLFLFLCM